MKSKFLVDPENILEFAEILTENSLDNEITDITEDDCLEISVQFNRDNRHLIDDLLELSEADV